MYKIILDNNEIIEIDYASTFFKRFMGLMGKKNFRGLLFKQANSNRYLSSIHTLFMKESIDLVIVDKDNTITQTEQLVPWRLFIPKYNNTKYIIELPENSIENKNIKINTKIKLIKTDK